MWYLQLGSGAQAQPALEQGVWWVMLVGAVEVSLAENRRHHLETVSIARRKAFIKRFPMSWVSKTSDPEVQSLLFFSVWEIMASSVPAFAFLQQHQPVDPISNPRWHKETHRSVSNRGYQLWWKHPSVSWLIHADYLVWYQPLRKHLGWALVNLKKKKKGDFGVIL